MKNIKYSFYVLLIISLILSQCGCGGNESKSSSTFCEDWLLNTYCYINIPEADMEKAAEEAFMLARDYENKLSRTVEGSLVSQINSAKDRIEIDGETDALLENALNFCKASEYRLDIGIGSVSSLWDFTSENPELPDDAEVKEALSHAGAEKLRIEKEEECSEDKCTVRYFVSKDDPLLQLDLGAVAKGYIADKMAAYLKQQFVERAIISLGGNIYCLGDKEDGSLWSIGIEQPFNGDKESALEERPQVGILTLEGNNSVVTSGTYERSFEKDGVLYHHVLDPETGYPAETDLASATVIGRKSLNCDAYSTICLLYGSEKALSFIEETGGYECVLIKTDGSIITSSGAQFTEK